MKEANRQKSVLTDRYYRISMSCKVHMRLFETNKGANAVWVSKHMIAKPKEHQTDGYVDATAID